jgi:hypothetical protein
MRAAINMAWEQGGADFQSSFDKSTAHAIEMKKGRCGFCDSQVVATRGGFMDLVFLLNS